MKSILCLKITVVPRIVKKKHICFKTRALGIIIISEILPYKVTVYRKNKYSFGKMTNTLITRSNILLLSMSV